MMFFSNKAAGRAASAGRARGTGHVAICFFAQYPPSVVKITSGIILFEIKTFVAEGCRLVQDVKLDEGEKLTYVEMSFEDILDMIKNKQINDANTKIAVLEYTLKKKGI